MKKNVKDTSIASYMNIQKLGRKQQTVYEVIKRFPDSTDRELAKRLGFTDPNNVRPRRFELVELGWVVLSGRKRCSISGRTSCTWRINQWRGEKP